MKEQNVKRYVTVFLANRFGCPGKIKKLSQRQQEEIVRCCTCDKFSDGKCLQKQPDVCWSKLMEKADDWFWLVG